MAYTSLELFKKYVHADDVGMDDTLLQHLLDAAEQQIVSLCDRSSESGLLVEETDADGNTVKTLPKPLQVATLLLAAHYNDDRSAVSAVQLHEVPYGVEAIIKNYQELVKVKE